MQVKRFGVSLEEDLLDKLDEYVEKNQFPNRSRAIRYLIEQNIVKDKWEKNQEVAGAVVLLYDHHKRDTSNKSVSVQHDYYHLILSVQHVHLNHDYCLETIALKGKAFELLDLAEKLIAIKGVRHGELVMTAAG